MHLPTYALRVYTVFFSFWYWLNLILVLLLRHILYYKYSMLQICVKTFLIFAFLFFKFKDNNQLLQHWDIMCSSGCIIGIFVFAVEVTEFLCRADETGWVRFPVVTRDCRSNKNPVSSSVLVTWLEYFRSFYFITFCWLYSTSLCSGNTHNNGIVRFFLQLITDFVRKSFNTSFSSFITQLLFCQTFITS